jgi:AcrR family transcriptional regulator
MDQKLIDIINHSVTLFDKYGVRNVSMDEIASSQGISKKTLYRYVSNKKDLLEKIFIYNSELIEEKIKEIVQRGINSIEILLEISLVIQEQYRRMNPKLKYELNKYYPGLQDKYSAIYNTFVHRGMEFNMTNGIKEGLYREDLDVELTAQLYVNQLKEIHNLQCNPNELYSFEKIFKVMFENHIHSIASSEGLNLFEDIKERYKHNKQHNEDK